VSPDKKQGSGGTLFVQLSDSAQKCSKSNTIKQWSAFYGMLPLTEVTPEALFPNFNASYRIREEFTTEDKIYSLLLGVSSSVTRKSWIVDECPLDSRTPAVAVEKPSVSVTDSPEFLASVKIAVDAYLKQKDSEYEEVLEATVEQNKTSLRLDESLPTIWFRNGEIKQGEVLEQNQESITIKDKSGETRVIPRTKVLRIRFPKERVKI
jgi:hypothetical protein